MSKANRLDRLARTRTSSCTMFRPRPKPPYRRLMLMSTCGTAGQHSCVNRSPANTAQSTPSALIWACCSPPQSPVGRSCSRGAQLSAACGQTTAQSPTPSSCSGGSSSSSISSHRAIQAASSQQCGAAPACLLEGQEDGVDLVPRDADASVQHADGDAARVVVPLPGDADEALVGELGGISQQVVQDLRGRGWVQCGGWRWGGGGGQAGVSVLLSGRGTSFLCCWQAEALLPVDTAGALAAGQAHQRGPDLAGPSYLHNAAGIAQDQQFRGHRVLQLHIRVDQAAREVQHIIHHVLDAHLHQDRGRGEEVGKGEGQGQGAGARAGRGTN